jgi:hypothetical protein
MKKMLRRIVTLVLAATLFIMPASTALAAPQPVCIFNTPGNLGYEYQPEYVMPAQSQLFLNDYTSSNGYINIPAGKTFDFMLNCQSSAPYYIEIIQGQPWAGVVYTDVIQTGGTRIVIPPQSTDKSYLISITTINQPQIVDSYFIVYY